MTIDYHRFLRTIEGPCNICGLPELSAIHKEPVSDEEYIDSLETRIRDLEKKLREIVYTAES